MLATQDALPYRVLRCAARVFDEVHVLGTAGAGTLEKSRLCATYTPHPRDEFTPEDVAAINLLCRRLEIEYLLPGDDATTEFLAGRSGELVARAFPLPAAPVFRMLNDKAGFMRLCAELDLPAPATGLYSSKQQLDEAVDSGRLTYPFVVKPLNLSGGRGVVKVVSKAVLREVDYEPLIAQDYVEGRELSAFYLCRRGRILAEVGYYHDKHFVTFVRNEAVRRAAGRIVEHLQYDGVIGFDVMERADRSIALLECNPRFWYNMNYAMLAGLNFVEMGFADEDEVTRHVEHGTRIPRIHSPRSILTSALRHAAFWRVLRYRLSDPRHEWASRQGGFSVKRQTLAPARTGSMTKAADRL